MTRLEEEARRLAKKYKVPDPDFEIDEEALKGLSTRQQNAALKRMRSLEEIRRASPLHFYNPFKNPKQHAFHAFKTKWRVFLGGNQSGKTTAGVVDCLLQAQDEDSLPEWLRPYKKFHPPFRCRIGGQGRTEIEDFVFEKIRDWVTPDQLVGGHWKSAYDGQNYILHFKNGSYFQMKTYDQESNKWGGSTLDRVYFDEEPPADKLTEGRIRVMAKGGDLCFAMTPVNGITHMFDEFEQHIELADKHEGIAEDERMGLVLVDMDDNPYLSEAEKKEVLTGFSEEERAARKSGRFVALHGLIYGDFSNADHVIEAPDEPVLPENVHVVVGIDTGWAENAGCAVVWAYVTADDTLVVFHELLWSSSTIKQVTDEIHRVNTAFDCKPLYYVIDPVARNKQSQTGRSDQMVFADHGVVCIAGQNAVDHGLVMVRERLQGNEDGPKLKVWDTCTGLIKEFRTYRWKSPPRTGEDGTPRPYKKNDHRLDALRYLVASRPYLPDVPINDDRTELEKWMAEDQEKAGQEPQRTEHGGLLLY